MITTNARNGPSIAQAVKEAGSSDGIAKRITHIKMKRSTDPQKPLWPDRDRFVLSAGHASALLYSLLFLTGYELSIDDLQHFRQWKSATPGHPERRPGIEATTGPLGQGIGNAVGMAIAERWLAAKFNRDPLTS